MRLKLTGRFFLPPNLSGPPKQTEQPEVFIQWGDTKVEEQLQLPYYAERLGAKSGSIADYSSGLFDSTPPQRV